VSDIVVIPIVPSPQITVRDVSWEGPELRLGIHGETDAENAPILDAARRRMASRRPNARCLPAVRSSAWRVMFAMLHRCSEPSKPWWRDSAASM